MERFLPRVTCVDEATSCQDLRGNIGNLCDLLTPISQPRVGSVWPYLLLYRLFAQDGSNWLLSALSCRDSEHLPGVYVITWRCKTTDALGQKFARAKILATLHCNCPVLSQ